MSETSRKERILGVAERLFAHYGPAKTTVADIARACGIGVGSVYLDFASKEAILSALSRKNVSTVASRMQEAAPSGPATDRIVAMLEARVVALFDLAEGGQHGCDLVRCQAERRAAPPTSGALGQEVRSILALEIRRGASAGELLLGDVEEALDLIELAFVALSPPLVFQMQRIDAVTKARGLAVLVVRGLSAPASSPDAARSGAEQP
jgi:AcrR family transcriptional regulator